MNTFLALFSTLIALYVALRRLGVWIYELERSRETCMNEIQMMKPRDGKRLGTVLIGGGSIAGLLAARACHDHFEKVIVVEAEKPNDVSAKRARVPQSRSLHALLSIAQIALEKWFPEIGEVSASLGLKILPAGVNNYIKGIPVQPTSHPLHRAVASSRPGYERLVRTLVLGKSYPNIQYIQRASIVSVSRKDQDPKLLQGATIRFEDGQESQVAADLIIDCTGNARQGLLWLEQESFIQQDEIKALTSSFDSKMRYATFTVQVPPEARSTLAIPGGFENAGTILCMVGVRALSVRTNLSGPACYGGDLDPLVLFAMKIEDNRLYTGCGLYGTGRQLPHSISELLDQARLMRTLRPLPEWFFRLLAQLSELDITIDTLRTSPSSHIQYHLCKSLPPNFIAIGDSVMRVNPIYGQGCSKATIGAVVLHSLLQKCGTSISSDFSQRFFNVQHVKTEAIWTGTLVADYGQPTTVPCAGDTLAKGSALRWFLGKVQDVACVDPKVAETFLSIRMMLEPSIFLMSPSVFARIIWFSLITSPRTSI
ncbi:hypothetical protein DL96DRAFT_1767043 [Flagelloscypha sp. PMI_526]|nr:hypothetical protein DL96DRAFT_1767043 [Flagelloscypha sp. PMI_526]